MEKDSVRPFLGGEDITVLREFIYLKREEQQWSSGFDNEMTESFEYDAVSFSMEHSFG